MSLYNDVDLFSQEYNFRSKLCLNKQLKDADWIHWSVEGMDSELAIKLKFEHLKRRMVLCWFCLDLQFHALDLPWSPCAFLNQGYRLYILYFDHHRWWFKLVALQWTTACCIYILICEKSIATRLRRWYMISYLLRLEHCHILVLPTNTCILKKKQAC